MKRQIKPHKGGRTEQVLIRVTPLVKEWLQQQENISDYIIALVMKDMPAPEGWEYQGVLGWVEKE